MDGATDTVLHFEIKFGDDVELEGSVFLEVLFGGLIDDVPDSEPFDSLVFRAVSSAVDADDGSNVASVVFVSTVISSLLGHVDLWFLLNKLVFIYIK